MSRTSPPTSTWSFTALDLSSFIFPSSESMLQLWRVNFTCFTSYSLFFSSSPLPPNSTQLFWNNKKKQGGHLFILQERFVVLVASLSRCRPRFLSISNHVRYRAGKDPSVAAAAAAASNGPRPCSVRCLSNPGYWSSYILRSSRAHWNRLWWSQMVFTGCSTTYPRSNVRFWW